MITERGRVLAIEPDAVWVETVRHSSCQSCSLKKGCGHGLIGEAFGGQRHQLRVLLGSYRADQLAVDDTVAIDIPESVLVGGALLVYILPLLTLLVGAGLAQWWAGPLAETSDLPAVIGAVAGFALGLGLVALHGRGYRRRRSLQPVISAILPRVSGF